jgi:M-phase inducer tyrosine phosphatase
MATSFVCSSSPSPLSRNTNIAMPFLDHLIATTSNGSYKKQKRIHSINHSDDMSFFTATSNNQFLNPLLAPSRKKGLRFLQTNDEFTSDLEISFASNVSLNSPPRDHLSLPECEPMDISPAPVPKHISSGLKETSKPKRPRAFTSGARLFGSDLSNSCNPLLPSPHLEESSKATQSNSKRIQRSALPTEWLAAPHPELPAPAVGLPFYATLQDI